MAREPEKSGKAKTESTSGGAAKSASGAGQDQAKVTDYQGERHGELRAALAKRSEDGADMPAIVREFVAVWLPHHMVEVDLLVPALEDADVDEDRMASVAVRKDLLNILLADLIQSEAADGGKAKLDALSDALEAVIVASQQQAEALSVAIDESTLNALGPQMKARYERMKNRFADIDESVEEAMSLLAPRSLSDVLGAPARPKGQRAAQPICRHAGSRRAGRAWIFASRRSLSRRAGARRRGPVHERKPEPVRGRGRRPLP